MNKLSIKGSLIKKNNKESIESKDGKQWTKQTFIIQTDSEYNNQICFQLFGEDKIQLLESHNEGDEIEVFFNISSREYNNRYYHNIDAWKIDTASEIDQNKNKTENHLDEEEDRLPL